MTPIPLFILFWNLYFSYFLFFFSSPLFLPFSCFSYKASLIVFKFPPVELYYLKITNMYTKYSHQRRHLKKLSNFISSNLILNKRSWNYLVNSWFYFFINLPKTLNLQFLQKDLEFSSTQRKSFSLYSNMASPNMNGRLHLADTHQNSSASL